MTSTIKPVHIIGGGLAGCEAAWQLLKRGVPVTLFEMRPHRMTPAHTGDGLAELVCSNSLRSDDPDGSAVGLLHAEMRRCDSLVMKAADAARVPAGSALAVDRDMFSAHIEQNLSAMQGLAIRREEVTELPESDQSIIAAGPLASHALADAIREATGTGTLSFFDAIAPVVTHESIDMDIAWLQSRYDKGETADYINCPLDAEQYAAFLTALTAGDTRPFKEWEKDTPYFEGCLPIEVMAARGADTLRFGPMKPVGLTDPHTGHRPHAVVQLRRDNKLGTLYNLVGFQTKLSHGDQKRVFRMIPGLQNAEFARLGGQHRNTFIKSPILLGEKLELKTRPGLRFAGQITGCEGYVESAATGLLAGLFTAADVLDRSVPPPPATTALGALLGHITGGGEADGFQPMNINFGLLPPLETRVKKGRERKKALSARALEDIVPWVANCRLIPFT
ncbi:MAG: methylenetetrahydrofolate--tRNA-(uracil(54)-C(5))-methyltransferase (FADH(2)-oxidizing) TrmFO [Pseudomonadota bacterium]|nr:methylenetetrahydrofolate--tRNA-(uracil(54)-C(5))-methyltransferase (FADH(2)-oxidizing) TrmFO [Pseudomonadota bacterium]